MIEAKTLIKLARAIEVNAQTLIELCNNSENEILVENPPSSWEFLVQHELVYGNKNSGYIASSLLADIHDCLSQVTRRQTHIPDIQEWMEEIYHHIELYRGQLISTNNEAQGQIFKRRSEINRMVFNMIESIRKDVTKLEQLIDSKFGYVISLADKQKENTFFTAQAKRYAEKLTAINMEWVLRTADNDFYLFGLLHGKLMPQVEEYRKRLTSVINRMGRMLWALRRTDELTRVLKSYRQHIQSDGMVHLNLTDNERIHSPFNQITSRPRKGHADILNTQDQEQMIKLAKQLRPRQYFENEWHDLQQSEYNAHVIETKIEEIVLPIHLFEQHLIPFCRIALNQTTSALNYWQHHGQQNYSIDLWLWWIHRKLNQQDLSKGNMKINIQEVGRTLPDFSGNKEIYDLLVSIKCD